jgi:hypothetical protein
MARKEETCLVYYQKSVKYRENSHDGRIVLFDGKCKEENAENKKYYAINVLKIGVMPCYMAVNGQEKLGPSSTGDKNKDHQLKPVSHVFRCIRKSSS